MSAPPQPLLGIVGATASGKTAVAIALARRLGGELVSCDSMQVYRGLDIGTAKPTAEERAAAVHHLVDVADLGEGWSAGRWAEEARRVIADVVSRGRVPIVVGGTGLWLRALLRGLAPLPSVDVERRARLEAEADALGVPALHARLAAVDPEYAARIAPGDRQRVTRALEVYEQTGRPLAEWHRAQAEAAGPSPYRALLFGLDLPRDVLHARIGARVHAMVERGFVEEVRALRARAAEGRALDEALGYGPMLAHLRGECSLASAIEDTARDSRRYARRQLTWFRKEPDVSWVQAHPPPLPDLDALEARAVAFFAQNAEPR